MNSVNIIGRLTAEPELRRTQDGTAVCSYSLAVKRPRVKDTTDFIDCGTWRQGAEYLSQYGHKGDVVAVSGNLQVRSWSDKDGNKRKTSEVVTEAVELLSSKKETQSNTQIQGKAQQSQQGYTQQGFGGYQQNYPVVDIPDEQLPF